MLLPLVLAAVLLGPAPADTVPQALFRELRFRPLGPNRGGRASAVAGHAMLADQIAFLYTITIAADQQLGRQRYDELAGLLARARSELDAIVAAYLPSLKVAP